MDEKKKRTTNFSSNEKSVLSELVMKYKNTIENKRTDASTNSQKVAGWIRLAEEFNICTESYRTPNNLKTCWENIKRATKKQASHRKKEIFMTGGGKPQPPSTNNSANFIVEAVLGPALEGLSNIYDCDGPENEISTAAPTIIDVINWGPTQISSQKSIETIVFSTTGEEKENNCQGDAYDTKASTSKDPEEPEKTCFHNNKELWENWTPQSLKMPLTESLRSNNNGNKWLKRRRPKSDCSSDTLIAVIRCTMARNAREVKEKIELVQILKKNAAEEGNLRILILKEQLKQEQIKTGKLSTSDQNN